MIGETALERRDDTVVAAAGTPDRMRTGGKIFGRQHAVGIQSITWFAWWWPLTDPRKDPRTVGLD